MLLGSILRARARDAGGIVPRGRGATAGPQAGLHLSATCQTRPAELRARDGPIIERLDEAWGGERASDEIRSLIRAGSDVRCENDEKKYTPRRGGRSANLEAL